MSMQDQSNIYLVIIPRNYTNDIHICGRCKVQYTLLSLFLKHKEVCKENDFKELDTDMFLLKKSGINDYKDVASFESTNQALDKDNSQLNEFSNFSSKEETQTKQFKMEGIEGDSLCLNQKNFLINNTRSIIQQRSNLMADWKRTLQNDEEDIAALLANQLSSETSADEFTGDVSIDVHSMENSESTVAQMKNFCEKTENKVMYRGKLRKLFCCQVDGCMYKTLLRKDIERHSRVHTGERPFKCFLCEKAFNRTDKLLLHQRIHAGDKRYKCTKCDYASVDSGSLIKHLRVHNGERPFKCQLCSYRARDSSQLTVHLRTHTGDSPFICTNMKCKAAFKTNSDLKRHMVVHSEEKPYSCTYCSYKSTLKRNLQIHVQSQHPNGELKEYKCHLCPRFVLPTSRKLKNHLRKHHGIPEEKRDADFSTGEKSTEAVEKQETYKKRRRRTKRNADKIAVGVMNKAYDCKLCDASFVCQDSLVTHRRYHDKVDEAMRKAGSGEASSPPAEDDAKREKSGETVGDLEKKLGTFNGEDADLVLSENCEIMSSSSFGDSLRNAEILASLNSGHEDVGNMRQYVMISPEAVQSVYHPDEYAALVQN